jgi:sirohydrochlorin ferrochelatase
MSRSEGDESAVPQDPEDALGVVLVDHGSRRAESNQLFERFVELFARSTRHEIVEPAHMELAQPSVETAFARCVERGATRIVLAPYFLAPGKHWRHDLPTLAAAAAAKAGAPVRWLVSQPIGLHDAMVGVVDDRLTHCLSRSAGQAEDCEACAGTDRCQFRG